MLFSEFEYFKYIDSVIYKNITTVFAFLTFCLQHYLQMMLWEQELKEGGNHRRRCWSCRLKETIKHQTLANHQEPKLNLLLMRAMVMIFIMMTCLMNDSRL